MKAHAQPVIDRLHHQVNVFGRFQFKNRKPAVARDSKQVDDSAIARRKRRDLRVDVPRIEPRVDARRVGGHHGFQPPFRLRPVEPVLGVRSQRMAVRFHLPDQSFESRPSSGVNNS